jgi:hypothetical protein
MKKNPERFSDPTGITFRDENGESWEIGENGTLRRKKVDVKSTEDRKQDVMSTTKRDA